MLESIQQSFQERRVIWIGGIVSLLLIIAIAVGVFLNQPKPKAVVVNPSVELLWWKLDSNPAFYNDIIAGFNAIPGNTNVNIQIVSKNSSDNYYRELTLAQNRGIGPDIFTLSNDDLPAYKESISPIENFNGKSLNSYKQDFVDLVVRDTIDRDKVYGITSYVDTLQLYYNKSLLEQKLITRPASSWAELTRQVGLLTTKAQSRDTFVQSTISLGTGGRSAEGEPNIQELQDILPMLIFQNGGQLYDYQSQKPIFNSSGSDTSSPIYKAARFYLDFADSNSSRYSWNTASPNNVDAFVEGKLAYIINYSGFFEEIKTRNNRLKFDVANLPQVDESNKKTFGKFNMEVLSRDLGQKAVEPIGTARYQKAQDFLTYLASLESQQSLATKSGLPPAHRDVIEGQLQGSQLGKVFAGGALYADNYYKPDVKKTEQLWADVFQRVQYDNIPLSESLSIASEDYLAIVQDGPKERLL